MLTKRAFSLASVRRSPVRVHSIGRKSESFNDLLSDIENHRIEFARLTQNQRHIVVKHVGDTEESEASLPDRNTVLEMMIEHDIPVVIEPNQKMISPLEGFTILLQVVIVGAIIRTIFVSARGGASGAFKFGDFSSDAISADKVNVQFKDVAGVDAAKDELQDIIDFLKFPEKYSKIGAKIPKGVLLVGPPGTGKTLMARAIAGEAGVPFFSCSGSQFIEMFVGVGASRIRSLFEKASKKAPCIIFIDEIDAIGKTRSSGAQPGNDERDQTINQLLTAMDGFTENSGIIVLGATNRAELLDEALLRPGRFDRKVFVDLPDVKGRNAILKIHTQNKPLDASVDLSKIAKNTTGFSGADLANLANESAIYAAKEGCERIQEKHWDQAFEKLILGHEHPSLVITEKQRRILAFHEAGHALLGILVSDYDKVRKVSIIPRGSAGGATYFEPREERMDMALHTREYMENQIIVALGGRVAEEIVFGSLQVTTGASGDLESVIETAYHMVASYGFNETLGPAAWSDAPFDMSSDVFAEVRFLVEHCYQRAFELLNEYEFYLYRIAEALIEKEILQEDDIALLVEGITMERKEDKNV